MFKHALILALFWLGIADISQAANLNGHWQKKRVRVIQGSVDPASPMVQGVNSLGLINGAVCVPRESGVVYRADELCELPMATPSAPLPAPKIMTIGLMENLTYPDVKPEVPAPKLVVKDTAMTKKYTEEKDFAALRDVAINEAKIPPEIYRRALENYTNQSNKKNTSRACFMAADLTGSQGKTWLLCFKPKPQKPTVSVVKTTIGSGLGEGCKSNFINDSCPRFWGNKLNSCLTPGGNFITGESRAAIAGGRVFTPFKGLDASNSNSTERNIGIMTLTDHSGNSLEGKGDPRQQSQGAFVWPADFKQFPMENLSSTASGGGVALYSYPAKEDLQQFMNKRNPPYWNPECRAKIDSAAWIDDRATQKKLDEIYLKVNARAMENLLSEPESIDIPADSSTDSLSTEQ